MNESTCTYHELWLQLALHVSPIGHIATIGWTFSLVHSRLESDWYYFQWAVAGLEHGSYSAWKWQMVNVNEANYHVCKSMFSETMSELCIVHQAKCVFCCIHFGSETRNLCDICADTQAYSMTVTSYGRKWTNM